MKKTRIPNSLQPWLEARRRHKLSHAHVQMARELGMNPRKLGKLGSHMQEPWKLPLPQFIEQLYRKRFGKAAPDEVLSLEERSQRVAKKKAERKAARMESGQVSSETQLAPPPDGSGPVLIRHAGHTAGERSTCGWRDRLISHEDAHMSPAAWAHAVDIDGAKLHYHKRSTELYYVLDGAGTVLLDGVAHEVAKGTLVHIPPGVVHGARGRMRVLVVGIPDIADDDYFEVGDA